MLIFPEANRKDFEELPDYLKNGVKAHFCPNVRGCTQDSLYLLIGGDHQQRKTGTKTRSWSGSGDFACDHGHDWGSCPFITIPLFLATMAGLRP